MTFVCHLFSTHFSLLFLEANINKKDNQTTLLILKDATLFADYM